ncbi:Glycosyltransferase [Rhodovastum atsumiense]|uniref:Glycosyltransferase n=1 Tax=Rhodovastum atsumiense TaxID=504468 RepID=A0A5M6J0B7_9PROT|nr:glycosyltransferase family 2 protein [Rhodovastum atsumiense]KAA5614046.1 glycosyltransferase [Rhodovastum atsumiense]CAH2598859.1 Glycosyltransferase [Rhodovastum atsumiense]
MTTALSTVLLVAGFLLLTMILLLALEVIAASMAGEEPLAPAEISPHAPRIAVLVPAHDEGRRIVPLLSDLRVSCPASARVLVVADNCTDDTAAIARAEGAEVIERHDPGQRGKGFALAFGVAHLALTPPDIVVIIDADCRVRPGTVAMLATICAGTNRPVQSVDSMIGEDPTSASQRVAEFAWHLNTYVRSLGLARCGWPVRLMGTGMAIPWTALKEIDLATGNVVEDLSLSLDLTELGYPPLFCRSAVVESAFPSSVQGMRTQRQRWELGALRTAMQEGPIRLWRAARRRDLGLFVLSLDLMIPPLVLLVSATAALACAGLVLGLFWARWWSAIVPAAGMALLAAILVLAYFRFGRGTLRLRDLGGLLSFALDKVAIYRTGFGSIQTWVRTDRS